MKIFVSLAQWFGHGRSLSLALLLPLLAFRISDPAPVEFIRLKTFDFFQSWHPRTVTARPAVIVDIDEASLAAFGQWPWPRTIVADLVERLTQLGSAAIAFDVLFAEPDRMSPAFAADTFRDLDDAAKERLRRMPSNDQILADAFKKSKVILGQSGLHTANNPQNTRSQSHPLTGFATIGPDPSPYLVTFPGLLRNVPALEAAASGRGLLSIRPEPDGITRRIPLVMKAQNQMLPAITLEMLRVVTGAGVIIVRTDAAGIKSVAIPGLELPTDQHGQLWVYFSPHDPARYVSAKDVLEGRIAADRFERRLVLIGTSSIGLLDIKTSPIDAAIPGVEIHAQVLESALTGAFLTYPSQAIVYELLVILLIGAIVIVFAPIVGALTLFLMGAAISVLLIGWSWYCFLELRLLIDFSYPLISSSAVFFTLLSTNYLREHHERKRIRTAFGQYLSPVLVERLARSHERLVLGGEERTMTIMFSDVRGFTTISEVYKRDPQGLTSLMNSFLTPLTNVIVNKKGTIDKYIGDAIMAFWNAPLDDPGHELNACDAALAMIERMEEFNREREKIMQQSGGRFIPLHIGVGINTGQCVVGNMGSDLRFDYSVLGDTVNLASRLEGQTKSYGVSIIIGANTAAAAKGHFAVLELDLIAVKGKSEPEFIYTILGRKDVAEDNHFIELRALLEKMLSCYRIHDWAGALQTLDRCRTAAKAFSLDPYFDIYSERIRNYQNNPPPPDWNGVFEAKTK